jgi:hypothetical protein
MIFEHPVQMIMVADRLERMPIDKKYLRSGISFAHPHYPRFSRYVRSFYSSDAEITICCDRVDVGLYAFPFLQVGIDELVYMGLCSCGTLFWSRLERR